MRKSAPRVIPGGRSVAEVRAFIDAEALAPTSDNDDDADDEYSSFFGDLPNPDPHDFSPRDICGDFISLFVGSRKCQQAYPKMRKINVFYEALTVEKEHILGREPPDQVQKRFNIWRQDVKKRTKWTLDGIAESVFIIARHVHDLQEELLKRGRRAASTDSKIEALVLMYSFFLSEINLNEANRRSQNKAAAAMNLQIQQKKPTKSTKPLPPNFRYDANKVCILFLSFIHGWILIKTYYLVHYL